MKKTLSTIILISLLFLMGCSVENIPVREEIEKAQPQEGIEITEREDSIVILLSDKSESEFFVSPYDNRSLSWEEASDLGIGTLRNFLEANLADVYIEMSRVASLDSLHGRYDWLGRVSASERDLNRGEFLYLFRIDAFSRRIYELSRKYELSNLSTTADSSYDYLSIAENFASFFSGGHFVLSVEAVDNSDLPPNHLLFLATLEWFQLANEVHPFYLEIILLEGSGKLNSIRSYFPSSS